VASELMAMLTRVVASHPNPRKVFVTVVPRLLPALLSATAARGAASADSARTIPLSPRSTAHLTAPRHAVYCRSGPTTDPHSLHNRSSAG
jgi:hypothetical protein